MTDVVKEIVKEQARGDVVFCLMSQYSAKEALNYKNKGLKLLRESGYAESPEAYEEYTQTYKQAVQDWYAVTVPSTWW